MKKYSIILADPPWKYDFSKDNSDKIETHYPPMSLSEICKLNIPSDDNAVLYLWATAPKLLEALAVMKAWGFTYKTNAVWDKGWIGMGYWFRGQHELLLVGTKGKFSPPKQEDRISSVLRVKKAGHSDKPDHIKIMIEKWYPDVKKLELFARNHTPLIENKQWDVWGNEVESDIILGQFNH